METTPRPERPAFLTTFPPAPELDAAAYDRLAREVRGLLGIDLSQYKPAQVWRRVNGFASARGLADSDALVARVRQDTAFRQAFLDMLTINVSEFFRNPEAWDALVAVHTGAGWSIERSVSPGRLAPVLDDTRPSGYQTNFAIFSADWPIDSPVDGSAIAGVTGTRSRGRTCAKMPSR